MALLDKMKGNPEKAMVYDLKTLEKRADVILPFVDHFPTDLELYKIMTTKWIDNSVQKDG